MIIDILQIAIIVVCIVDLSGIIQSIQKLFAKFLSAKDFNNIKLPLISCSLCVTWWTSLIYIIATGNFTLTNIMLSILIATMTSVIKDLILSVKDIFTKILEMTQWL